MDTKTVAIVGATGLIGSHLMEISRRDKAFQEIRLIVRRAQSGDDVLKPVIIDFTDEVAFRQAIAGCDAVFCAVGTTLKKVKGDKVAYRKVDYDIPVTTARLCAETGVNQFLLVSAVGANSESNNFYLKLKGEVDDAVRAMNIPSVSVFRPSILLGAHPEFRGGERVGQVVMQAISFMLPSKYKPIHARDVARAMLAASKDAKPGFNVYHYKEMKGLFNSSGK